MVTILTFKIGCWNVCIGCYSQVVKLQEEHETVLSSNASKISELTSKFEETEKHSRLLQMESQKIIDDLNQKLKTSEAQCHNTQKYALIVFVSCLPPPYLMFL